MSVDKLLKAAERVCALAQQDKEGRFIVDEQVLSNLRAAIVGYEQTPKVSPVLLDGDGKLLPYTTAEQIRHAIEEAEHVALHLDKAGVDRANKATKRIYTLLERVKLYAFLRTLKVIDDD